MNNRIRTWATIQNILEKKNVADEYIEMLQDVVNTSSMDMSTIESIVEIAHLAGALPELLTTIPSALEYGLGNFYKNYFPFVPNFF